MFAFRQLDVWPNTFGYHEFWHVFVLVATGLEWWVVAYAAIPRL